MKTNVLAVIGGLVIGLSAAAPLRAQHQHPAPPGSPERDPASPAVVLGRLVEVTEETVRGLEAAIADGDTGLARRWTDGYVQSMAALVEYVEESDRRRIAEDLPAVEDALGRQAKVLRTLKARSPRELREAVGASLDAGQRAREATRAAREEASSQAHGEGHHRGARRGGCGHH